MVIEIVDWDLRPAPCLRASLMSSELSLLDDDDDDDDNDDFSSLSPPDSPSLLFLCTCFWGSLCPQPFPPFIPLPIHVYLYMFVIVHVSIDIKCFQSEITGVGSDCYSTEL